MEAEAGEEDDDEEEEKKEKQKDEADTKKNEAKEEGEGVNGAVKDKRFQGRDCDEVGAGGVRGQGGASAREEFNEFNECGEKAVTWTSQNVYWVTRSQLTTPIPQRQVGILSLPLSLAPSLAPSLLPPSIHPSIHPSIQASLPPSPHFLPSPPARFPPLATSLLVHTRF